MRISDWSSDVCSSDLPSALGALEQNPLAARAVGCDRLEVRRGHARRRRRHDAEMTETVFAGNERHLRIRSRAAAHRRRDIEDGRPDAESAGQVRTGGLELAIGSAPCRDRVCQNVWISVDAVALNKKHRW